MTPPPTARFIRILLVWARVLLVSFSKHFRVRQEICQSWLQCIWIRTHWSPTTVELFTRHMIPRNLCLFSQYQFQSVAMFTPNAAFEERSSVISETPPPTITFVSLVRHCSVSFPTDIHVTHQISLGKAFPVGKTFPTPIPTYIVKKHIDGHVTCVTAFSIC